MNDLKIIKINTILFFFIWNIILFSGADHPPPIGFLWLIFLIAILDFIQYRYLQYFLPRLRTKSKYLFVKNMLFFAIGCMLISILFLLIRYKLTLKISIYNILAWIAVLTIVGIIYSIVFWLFNVLLLKIKI